MLHTKLLSEIEREENAEEAHADKKRKLARPATDKNCFVENEPWWFVHAGGIEGRVGTSRANEDGGKQCSGP